MLAVDFKSFVGHLGYSVLDFQVVALQGVKPIGHHEIIKTDNKPDQYNDTIIIIDGSEVYLYLGTINPGRYYTQTAPHPDGAANLTYGEHWYVEGTHMGHPAFRALNEVNRVWRDRDRDFGFDPDEQIIEGKFGVNIHAGGSSSYIGKNSAGCINIAGGWNGQWTDFRHKITRHLKDKPGKPSFPVTLWRGNDFFKFIEIDEIYRHQFVPTLYPGIKGIWAERVQRALSAKGFILDIDGDWMNQTTKAVVDFQISKGLKPDAIVGPATWSRLND